MKVADMEAWRGRKADWRRPCSPPVTALLASCVVLVVLSAKGGDCLRDVRLRVEPSAVERGQQVRLICEYDLEGDSLYSVKWYRGSREFYRYVHSDKSLPTTKVFAIPGLNVDLSHSNATQVVVTAVGVSLAGNVSCEVTTDQPKLLMAQALGYMTVVALPRSPPKLWAHQDRYEAGDRLIANCTAPPATPPAQLSFQINNRTVPSGDTAYHLTTDGEKWSALTINMPLDLRHFRQGRLTLQCTATLPAGFVVKSEPQELGVRPSEPVPERVTSSLGSRECASLLLLLPVLGMLR